MQILLLILCWCYFSCLKIYSEKLFNAFISKWFLKSLWQRRHRLVFAFFFWEIIASTIKFSLKPPCFLEVMVLTFWFISIFQRNDKRFIQLQYIFLKCYMNKFSNQYLLFPHFPVLWNLHLFTWRVVSMLLRSW